MERSLRNLVLAPQSLLFNLLRLFFAVALCSLTPLYSSAQDLTIATGGQGTTYNVFGQNIAQLGENELGMDIEVVASIGSMDNIKRILSLEAQMAIVQADALELDPSLEAEFRAKYGTLKPSEWLAYVFPLFNEQVHILVYDHNGQSNGLSTFSDLDGKRVAVGPDTSGSYLTARIMANAAGITPSFVHEFGQTDIAALRDRKVDAIFFVEGTPAPNMMSVTDKNVRLLDVTSAARRNVSYYTPTVIRKSVGYPFVDRDVETLEVRSVLITEEFEAARPVECDRVRKLANVIVKELGDLKGQELQDYHERWGDVDINFQLGGWRRTGCVDDFSNPPSLVVGSRPEVIARRFTENISNLVDASLTRAVDRRPPLPSRGDVADVGNPDLAARIGIAAGPGDDAYKMMSMDISHVAALENVAVESFTTSGSLENIAHLLKDRRIQMAFVQSDVLDLLKEGSVGPATDAKQYLRSLYPLHDEEVHIISRSENFERFADLEGARVAIGGRDTGTYITAMQMMSLADISFETVLLDVDAALLDLDQGRLDAVMVVTGAPFASLTRKRSQSGYRLLSVEHPDILKHYKQTTLDRIYPFMTQNVNTVATTAILVTFDYATEAGSGSKCERVRKVARIIAQNARGYLRTQQSASKKWFDVDLDQPVNVLEPSPCRP